MKKFVIFRVLVLYNFELKQKHSSYNSQFTLIAILKVPVCVFSCTLTKMWTIMKRNRQNLDNCLSGTKLTNMATFVSLG